MRITLEWSNFLDIRFYSNNLNRDIGIECPEPSMRIIHKHAQQQESSTTSEKWLAKSANHSCWNPKWVTLNIPPAHRPMKTRSVRWKSRDIYITGDPVVRPMIILYNYSSFSPWWKTSIFFHRKINYGNRSSPRSEETCQLKGFQPGSKKEIRIVRIVELQ